MMADTVNYPSTWPQSLGSQLDLSTISPILEDQLDFSGDSTYSPNSPLSPVLSSEAFSFGDYNLWLDPTNKTAPSFPKQEQFDKVDMSLFPSKDGSDSPSIDPAELIDFNVTQFGQASDLDMNDLFQTRTSFDSSNPTSRKHSLVKTDPADEIQVQPAKEQCTQRLQRKRKTSESVSSSRSSSPPPTTSAAPKRVTHNLIEKRYRTNLNDKIAALRNAVPSLRVAANRLQQQEAEQAEAENDNEDLGGLAPANKLNKATILSKATEYINHLEKQNNTLARENDDLRNRVAALEMAVINSGTGLGTSWC